ncbi:SusD/RagB family nutrient-binding outer membrane lipoprotein [Spirosoma sp. SC4-14]|uniref:SusD/RagB family nutrient-binding outer membrane lipoprotein n=1 Tax=Spirosoma sp. SC4-14 TaxID=3128900 RepID=UPI0030D2B9D9
MKRIIITCLLGLLSLGTFLTGCKQSEIDSAYINPSGAVSADVQRLWAGMLFNERVSPRYWNLYTFLIPEIGTYSQLNGFTTTNGVYEQVTAYNSDRWNVYYTQTMARYRELEKVYNTLGAEDKAGLQLFLETARIFLYDQTGQMIDLWGDIPFKTAGQLNAQGTISLATYDNSKTTYTDMLTDLKRISDYLATATPSSFYTTQFTSYDYVNKGSILKWRKYCNSLILRLAMRISNADETTAKALVTTILNNPNQYPLVDSASESITIQPATTTSNLVAVNDMRNGFGVNPYAPSYLIDNVMAPANDPRLPVYFTTNASGKYTGVVNTWNATQLTAAQTANAVSRWDSTTFSENNLFPGILMTSAESWFNKAEAYERWGLGNAKTAYESGIRQSIAFWYGINNNSSYTGKKDTAPTEAQITAFLAAPSIAYGTDNLKKIATQKWVDYTVMQATQAWAEARRTKLIGFTFPTDNGSATAKTPPTRLLYPTSESSLNTANYNSVSANDKLTTTIFWDVK